MPAHIHAETIMEYAKDALETDRPWEQWEVRQFFKDSGSIFYGGWRDCAPSDMTFPNDYEYRRKPRTININGHEVPEPVREPLECGTEYFIPIIRERRFAIDFYWTDEKTDKRFLERGLIHLTEEAAIAHARALLSFTAKPGVSDE